MYTIEHHHLWHTKNVYEIYTVGGRNNGVLAYNQRWGVLKWIHRWNPIMMVVGVTRLIERGSREFEKNLGFEDGKQNGYSVPSGSDVQTSGLTLRVGGIPSAFAVINGIWPKGTGKRCVATSALGRLNSGGFGTGQICRTRRITDGTYGVVSAAVDSTSAVNGLSLVSIVRIDEKTTKTYKRRSVCRRNGCETRVHKAMVVVDQWWSNTASDRTTGHPIAELSNLSFFCCRRYVDTSEKLQREKQL